MIMLNLFTAVIIENFEKQQEHENWKVDPEHLDRFIELWADYDNGSGTIDPKDLEILLVQLPPPLGLGPLASTSDVLKFVYDLEIPLVVGRVPFRHTVYELVRRAAEVPIPNGETKRSLDRYVVQQYYK